MFDTLLAALAPHITEILSALLVSLLGMIAMAVRSGMTAITGMIREHLGLQAEKIWQDTLHRALRSGVLAVEDTDFASEDERLNAIVDYARSSSPETIAKLGASGVVLRSLAQAKVNELNGAAAAALG